MIRRSLLAALAAALLPAAPAVHAQSLYDAVGWNGPRVLELVRRGRELRSSAAVDAAMATYQSEARGYVYFFVDRPDREEHLLVKADQVALELFWRAPGTTRQRIIGQRDERVLPTSIRYHLDHLTVVQDDFGDRIRLGDGDEVSAVTHPLAPGSEEVYDFQLVDSLTLAYGQDGQEVRVYEIQVRPKELDSPAYVGTLFLDRASAAVVRMNFSFTPSSYVDPYLDYIRISLNNSLWMGRYWLPYRQEVEIRREIPVLDFSAGSVIRSRFDIGPYDFNVELPQSVFRRPRVSSVSPNQRASFAFDRGLFDEIEEEGLTISPTMEEVRTQVREVVEDEVLSGLAGVRFSFDGVSDFARYNRAEGVFVGGGITFRPFRDARLRTAGGYAFGRRKPSARLLASTRDGYGHQLSAYWDEMGDIGGNPGASPLVNTMSAASGSKDYLDPYFRRGATVMLRRAGASGTTLSLRWERHESAEDVVSDGPDTAFRPVLSIDEGTLISGTATTEWGLPGEGRLRVAQTLGRLESSTLSTSSAGVAWSIGGPTAVWTAEVEAEGAFTSEGSPAQMLHLLGGRHTLPGQPYRGFVGNGYWLARAVTTLPVRPPYVGLRVLGAVGSTYLGSGVQLPPDWALPTTDGLRGSVGLGVSVGWDSLFLDVSHGVRGGTWEAVFSVSERFAGWM